MNGRQCVSTLFSSLILLSNDKLAYYFILSFANLEY